MSKPRRSLVKRILLALLAVLALAYAGLWGLAARRDAQAMRAWAATGWDVEALGARYPRKEPNDTAVDVEALGAPLGVLLVPKGERHELQVGPEALRGAATTYVNEQLADPSAVIHPPGDDLVALLREYRNEIRAVADRLRSGPPPRWTIDVDAGYETPLPNLSGILRLHRILLADALAQSHAGRDALALASMDASWQLGGALRERPELISQLISVACMQLQAATLRKLERVPVDWRTRLAEATPVESMHDAFRFEAWSQHASMTTPRVVADAGNATGLSRLAMLAVLHVARPYLVLSAAELADRQLAFVQALEAAPPCAGALGVRDPWLDLSSWNALRFAGGNSSALWNAHHRAEQRAALQLELTLKVLGARQLARRGGGTDAERAALQRSRCPEGRWAYEPTDDGGFTLRFEGELPPLPTSSVVVPLEHVEPPTPGP